MLFRSRRTVAPLLLGSRDWEYRWRILPGESWTEERFTEYNTSDSVEANIQGFKPLDADVDGGISACARWKR